MAYELVKITAAMIMKTPATKHLAKNESSLTQVKGVYIKNMMTPKTHKLIYWLSARPHHDETVLCKLYRTKFICPTENWKCAAISSTRTRLRPFGPMARSAIFG